MSIYGRFSLLMFHWMDFFFFFRLKLFSPKSEPEDNRRIIMSGFSLSKPVTERVLCISSPKLTLNSMVQTRMLFTALVSGLNQFTCFNVWVKKLNRSKILFFTEPMRKNPSHFRWDWSVLWRPPGGGSPVIGSRSQDPFAAGVPVEYFCSNFMCECVFSGYPPSLPPSLDRTSSCSKIHRVLLVPPSNRAGSL